MEAAAGLMGVETMNEAEAKYRRWLAEQRKLLTAEQWDGFVAVLKVEATLDGYSAELVAELVKDCEGA